MLTVWLKFYEVSTGNSRWSQFLEKRQDLPRFLHILFLLMHSDVLLAFLDCKCYPADSLPTSPSSCSAPENGIEWKGPDIVWSGNVVKRNWWLSGQPKWMECWGHELSNAQSVFPIWHIGHSAWTVILIITTPLTATHEEPGRPSAVCSPWLSIWIITITGKVRDSLYFMDREIQTMRGEGTFLRSQS